MIRPVFYIGSMIIISLYLLNQYDLFQEEMKQPIKSEVTYNVTDKLKKAMKYHGITNCITIVDTNNKEYYVFIRDGEVINMFDYKSFPKLKKYLEE
jgi:hypothetical protein